MSMKPYQYAQVGQRFHWLSDSHSFLVVATPTGWFCWLSIGEGEDDSLAMNWQIADKDHHLNPRALWNDSDWLPPSDDRINEEPEHQKIADMIWAQGTTDVVHVDRHTYVGTQRIIPPFDDMQPGDKKAPSFLGDVLLCPRCGGRNLSHQSFEIFNGPGEDSIKLDRITVEGAEVIQEDVRRRGSNNPSPRRDGFIVRFECENCTGEDDDPDLLLNFSQHKGETHVFWTVAPEN